MPKQTPLAHLIQTYYRRARLRQLQEERRTSSLTRRIRSILCGV
jgi:hypothetical protein